MRGNTEHYSSLLVLSLRPSRAVSLPQQSAGKGMKGISANDDPKNRDPPPLTGGRFFTREAPILTVGCLLVLLLVAQLCVPKSIEQMKMRVATQGPAAAHAGVTGPLIIVSMNLAMLVPSKAAPTSWNEEKQIEAVKRELLQGNPDVLALQECPSLESVNKIFQGYIAIGSHRSHAGHVVLMVRQDLAGSASRIQLSSRLPAVMMELAMRSNQESPDDANAKILVASVHLEPFERGSIRRRNQVQELIKISDSFKVKVPLIIAGDTNMRDAEDGFMENDLKLQDVWKMAGSNPLHQYSWDTVNKPDGYFNRYYGSDTRQYQRRYDRIYVTNSCPLNVSDFSLIASKPISPSRDHFLSDHFGLATEIQIVCQNFSH